MDGLLPDGGCQTSARLFRGVENDGPAWAEDGVEVEDEGDEIGGVLGIGYDSDFVGDSAICVRVLRGCGGSIVGGVEEGLGFLLDWSAKATCHASMHTYKLFGP